MPQLAVIIPVLSDSDALRAVLADLPPNQGIEMIVVDGGGDPRLAEIAAHRPDIRVIRSPPGRGRQMNAGARAATGDIFVFLHADSRLPPGWDAALLALPVTVVGGWFQFALDDRAWQARVIERVVHARVRLLRLPYGDQGLFVRRPIFDRLEGFREWPLMEDVDFVRRLTAAGPVRELPLALRTSSRRWRRDGWLRRSARNLLLVTLYFAGVSPTRLARWYAAP